MCALLENWLPKVLVDSFISIPIIKRVHLHPDPISHPRITVVRLLSYRDQVAIQRAAKCLKEVRYEGHQICIFPDFSTETHNCQWEFDGFRRTARSSVCAIWHAVISPSSNHAHRLRKVFKLVQEAERFLCGMETPAEALT